VLLATTMAHVAIVLGIATFPTIAPELAARIGVAPSVIGYQMALVYGTAMLTSPVVGLLAARWGACRTLQVGLAIAAIGLALGLTANIWALAATSVMLGLGIATVNPAGAHLLFRYTPPRNRNLFFSLKQTSVPLGWTVMALLAPTLALAFGWQWALVAVLIACLATMAALQPFRAVWDDDRAPRAAGGQKLFAGLSLVWRHRPLRWISITSLCLSSIQLCLSTFLVTMLVAEAGYSLVTAGLMLSATHGAGVFGRVLWGYQADRHGGSLAVLRGLSGIMMVCCVLCAFLTPAWPLWTVMALFIVFGATAVGWNGLFMAEVARHSPQGMVSVATAGALVWNYFGTLSGPALFATVYRWNGSYSFTYGLLTVVAAAGLGFLALYAASIRRES
jgi:predicted MFS family arabinose efflux permease